MKYSFLLSSSVDDVPMGEPVPVCVHALGCSRAGFLSVQSFRVLSNRPVLLVR